MDLLTYVKTSLRITLNDTNMNALLTSLIASAKLDLTKTADVSVAHFDDCDLAPLLNRAIALFVGANFTQDADLASKYMLAYNSLKTELATANAYSSRNEE